MCPRGRPRGQGRPRGLHLWLFITGKLSYAKHYSLIGLLVSYRM